MSLDQKVARAVYTRDGWKCRHCGNRNGLHPHHVVYKSHGGADVLNNLITLCWKCHRGHHDAFLAIIVLELTDNDLIVRFERKRNWKPNV